MVEHHISPLTRDSHGFCVLIRVSWAYCAFKVLRLSTDQKKKKEVLRLSREAKYLNPRSRLWVIERDPHMQ